MRVVDVADAEDQLADLVEALERRREPEVVITRGGRPVARLLPANVRLGVAKGRFEVPNSCQAVEYVARLFGDCEVGDSPAIAKE